MIQRDPVYEEVLDKWREKYPNPNDLFVRDGVINELLWRKAEEHIVFLLKENNCAPGSVSWRAPKEEQEDFRLLCDRCPWREVGQWAYGLLHRASHPSFLEADKDSETACRQIAIVNLKKTAGLNVSKAAEIETFAKTDKEFLQQQLDLLKPDIIVCCGKDLVFRLATIVFPDAAKAKDQVIASSQLVRGQSPVRVLRVPNRIWIDFIHPSMRRGSRKEKYEHLMNLVRSAKF